VLIKFPEGKCKPQGVHNQSQPRGVRPADGDHFDDLSEDEFDEPNVEEALAPQFVRLLAGEDGAGPFERAGGVRLGSSNFTSQVQRKRHSLRVRGSTTQHPRKCVRRVRGQW